MAMSEEALRGRPGKGQPMPDGLILMRWREGDDIASIIKHSGRRPEDVRAVLFAGGAYRTV